MEKRSIRLEINGVVCGLITEESDAYMQDLAAEVGGQMQAILSAAPYITREAAALTVALGCLDDGKKAAAEAFSLRERVEELEVEAELWQEEKDAMLKAAREAPPIPPEAAEQLERLTAENAALSAKAGEAEVLREQRDALRRENEALRAEAEAADRKAREREESERNSAPELPAGEAVPSQKRKARRKNPMRRDEDAEQMGLVSFFEV